MATRVGRSSRRRSNAHHGSSPSTSKRTNREPASVGDEVDAGSSRGSARTPTRKAAYGAMWSSRGRRPESQPPSPPPAMAVATGQGRSFIPPGTLGATPVADSMRRRRLGFSGGNAAPARRGSGAAKSRAETNESRAMSRNRQNGRARRSPSATMSGRWTRPSRCARWPGVRWEAPPVRDLARGHRRPVRGAWRARRCERLAYRGSRAGRAVERNRGGLECRPVAEYRQDPLTTSLALWSIAGTTFGTGTEGAGRSAVRHLERRHVARLPAELPLVRARCCFNPAIPLHPIERGGEDAPGRPATRGDLQ